MMVNDDGIVFMTKYENTVDGRKRILCVRDDFTRQFSVV